jgi:hypothetical protein
LALKAKTESKPLLWVDGLIQDVYGNDVGRNPIFRDAFEMAWNKIHTDGVEAALQSYIDSKQHQQQQQ